MTTKKDSPAIAHMKEIAGRANEHLIKKLEAKIEISKLKLTCDKLGAYHNPYLSLEQIIENCEPILADKGIDITFNDITHVFTADDNVINPSVAVIKMNAIYVPTQTEYDSLTFTAQIEDRKQNSQGKKSAITYAKRVLYTNFLSLSETDDDGTGTMGNRERLDAIQKLCGWNQVEKSWEFPELESIGDMARKTFFILQKQAQKKKQDEDKEAEANKKSGIDSLLDD